MANNKKTKGRNQGTNKKPTHIKATSRIDESDTSPVIDILISAPYKETIDAKGEPEASTRVRAGGLNFENKVSAEGTVPSLTHVRAAFFVDGFNLYHGINECDIPHLKWLNLWALAEAIKLPNERVAKVVWCSATSQDTDKAARHSIYMRALKSVGVEVILGHWADDWITCRRICDRPHNEKTFHKLVEKEGDVNLALRAATSGNDYDKCYIITGDSDQVPTLKYIRDVLRKKIAVFFPPNRTSKHLRDLVSTSKEIPLSTIESCRFNDEISSNGYPTIHCPKAYLLPKNWQPIQSPLPIQPADKVTSQKKPPIVEFKPKRKVFSRT